MVKLIAGLGNPGEKYEKTKHNVGFMVLDELAKDYDVNFKTNKDFVADIAEIFVNGEKVYLVKPLTFMNESGRSIAPLLAYYNIDLADFIVISDDMDSPIGRVRLRQKGSSGGQNGIKSVIQHTGTQNFNRIKVGIGRPKGQTTVVNHVLSGFDKIDQDNANSGVYRAVDSVKYFLEHGDFMKAMNKFNGK